MMTFSEFGRARRRTAARGPTTAPAHRCSSSGARSSLASSAHPSLEKLEDGNLKHHTDFRQVYASVLDGWLGVPSKEVLGGEFNHVPVLKT